MAFDLKGRWSLTGKVIVLSAIAMFLGIPLVMIHGIVRERRGAHARVVADIARMSAGEQTISGPLLWVRYRVNIRERTEDPLTRRVAERVRVESREQALVPESLDVRSVTRIEERYRGIYKAQVFHSLDTLTATFRIPPRYGIPEAEDVAGFDPASIVVEVSDARGLRREPVATLDGRPLEVRPGSGFGNATQGFSAVVGDWSAGGSITIGAVLDLTGTQRLSFVPVGKETRVEMRSTWPHPSFQGGFLPESRTVGADGFTAVWQLSHFATNIEQLVDLPGNSTRLHRAAFGVGFVQSVDLYQQSERAVKYGLLCVGLTFLAFFMFEVLRRLSIHPIQYGLVGLALALFFLLVISLSEHIPFAIAYLIASVACVGLLAFYLGHVLGSLARGAGFAAMLGTLYAVLYVLLQSEDYALLLGSLLLFGILTLIMVVTRRVDWYRLGDAAAEPRS